MAFSIGRKALKLRQGVGVLQAMGVNKVRNGISVLLGEEDEVWPHHLVLVRLNVRDAKG